MRQFSVAEVHAQKVAELGLDPTVMDLTSVEAIAAALRRAASFLCPCTAPTLTRAVVRPLRGLVHDLATTKALVEDTLEAMVAHGDILEHRDIEGEPRYGAASLLYAAPTSFVSRDSGAVILLGVASDYLSPLPDEFESRVESVNHQRHMTPVPDEDLRYELLQLGLIEISYDDWLRFPPRETSTQHIARLDQLLDAAPPSRDVPGLLLLDPTRGVRYYRGRWVEPHGQTGRFVARRRQAYGADLWCYLEMRDGSPERLVDFPAGESRWRGCDEAWHLQMAIDALRGEPQRFRLRPETDGARVLQFFSPVPLWARRRWDAVGEPVSTSGCLFAYRLAEAELAEEMRFAREALCLDGIDGTIKRR